MVQKIITDRLKYMVREIFYRNYLRVSDILVATN